MIDKKSEWTLESAMEIMMHPTVDSKIWAEAVEWLLLYGPPEVRNMLEQASGHATRECFPDLEPSGYNEKGEPCYEIEKLAKHLGIEEDEAKEILARKENAHGVQQIFAGEEAFKKQ
ncbi:MAG: hypothetical protein OEV64_07725 [Desulfobulbaceae bacterium]|nr:hypothetical protein [Desulfobulbaceae bacterium]